MVNIPEDYNINHYKKNNDGSIDVYQDVDMQHLDLSDIPIKFNIIEGNFNIKNNNITSLKNSPKKVYGNFNCSYNNLISLEGCPDLVLESFDASHNFIIKIGKKLNVGFHINLNHNLLESLDNMPDYVDGTLSLTHNKLNNLIGCSEEIGLSLILDDNLLRSLEGCPKYIGMNFEIQNNLLSVLDFFPEEIENKVFLFNNNLTMLPPDISILNIRYKSQSPPKRHMYSICENNIDQSIIDEYYEIELEKDPLLIKSVKSEVSEELYNKYEWVIISGDYGLL